MSVSLKTVTAIIAAATGAAVPAVAPAEPSIWSIIVLGIPLSVLAASLAGSAVRSLREPSTPDTRIPKKALAMVTDGFVGGWLAVLLVNLPFTKRYLGGAVPPEVIGALCALLVQFLREHFKEYFDQFYATALGLFGRRKSAPTEPPSGGNP